MNSQAGKDCILVTGATGFIGSSLVNKLVPEHQVKAVVRKDLSMPNVDVVSEDLNPATNWSKYLGNVSSIIHLAARVHIMHDTAVDPLSEFRKVNVEGTLNLARQAAKAQVRRFIFLSSIKVNGEETRQNEPFKETDEPAPKDSYAISKWEAEEGLFRIADASGMEVVVIRPPLVYGPGVKANFLQMMKWLYRGIPLPLGAIDNKRSLVALDNLIDLIKVCIHHPAAANQVFLVSDGEDLSTTELLRRLARAMGRWPKLVPIPSKILKVGLGMFGKADIAKRICGSLQVDIRKARKVLGWQPPVSVDEGLEQTATWFLHSWGKG